MRITIPIDKCLDNLTAAEKMATAERIIHAIANDLYLPEKEVRNHFHDELKDAGYRFGMAIISFTLFYYLAFGWRIYDKRTQGTLV